MTTIDDSELRSYCCGISPLPARLAPWMTELIGGHRLSELVTQHGSPVNVISSHPMLPHVDEIQRVAAERCLNAGIYFACKTNKSPAFVDAAINAGIGVDVASEYELTAALDRGVLPANMICTAAVKPQALLDRCIVNQITVAIDNHDEMNAIASRAMDAHRTAPIAIRLGGFRHLESQLFTRFGFDACGSMQWLDHLPSLPLKIKGVHFHLDGCCSDTRVSGIRQSLGWIDRLRHLGYTADFIDIGGGFPVSYLDDSTVVAPASAPNPSVSAATRWTRFWLSHTEALQGKRPPITYRNHGLGRVWAGGEFHGEANVYPTYQPTTRGRWLASILDAPDRADADSSKSIADTLRERNIELRCQPGRSLVDDCGMTVARVEFRKRMHDSDDWFIGVAMNRTQYRTTHDEFLVDPLLVPAGEHRSSESDSVEISGYLVGTYCTEYELLSLRKLRFPRGVRIGDLIVMPNTAGYLMHFMESRCHQFPLAENVVRGPLR